MSKCGWCLTNKCQDCRPKVESITGKTLVCSCECNEESD